MGGTGINEAREREGGGRGGGRKGGGRSVHHRGKQRGSVGDEESEGHNIVAQCRTHKTRAYVLYVTTVCVTLIFMPKITTNWSYRQTPCLPPLPIARLPVAEAPLLWYYSVKRFKLENHFWSFNLKKKSIN